MSNLHPYAAGAQRKGTSARGGGRARGGYNLHSMYDNGSESAPKIGKDGKRWDKKDGQIWAKMGEDGQR